MWRQTSAPSDEDALQEFEDYVLTQQANVHPWTPVTDYSLAQREKVEGPHAQLIAQVFRPLYVLDMGCGPEAALVQLLRRQGVTAYGMDSGTLRVSATLATSGSLLDRETMQSMRDACPSCDLVICREVLEHLTVRDIAVAVEHLCLVSRKWVYVTTRFAKTPRHFLSFDRSDDLDPTHISLLTKPLLRLLFVLQGYLSRPDLEAALDWRRQGRCLVMERNEPQGSPVGVKH